MKRLAALLLVLGLAGYALTAERPPQAPQRRDAEPKLVFVSAEKHAACLKAIPEGILTRDELDRIVFYDRKSAPFAYQKAGGSWHAVMHNISAVQPREPYGNPNREFPWNTGGMDNVTDGKDFKFIVLPDGKPLEVWRAEFKQGFVNESGMAWTGHYPKGSKVGEVLQFGDGTTFEVRVLTRKREGGGPHEFQANWRPAVYRPVRDRYHLAALLEKEPEYLGKLLEHYRGELDFYTLENQQPKERIIRKQSLRDVLPKMPEDLRKQLLALPFQDVTDHPWVEQGKHKALAPYGGLVPDGYQGYFLDSASCAKCHDTVGRHAQEFENRDWYGRVRGVDGIFSLPVCDESCVSYNGMDRSPVLNRKMLSAGMLKGKK